MYSWRATSKNRAKQGRSADHRQAPKELFSYLLMLVVANQLLTAQVRDVKDIDNLRSGCRYLGKLNIYIQFEQGVGDRVQHARPVPGIYFDQGVEVRSFLVDYDLIIFARMALRLQNRWPAPVFQYFVQIG